MLAHVERFGSVAELLLRDERAAFHRLRLCSLQEAYFRYMAENPTAGLTLEEEEDNIDYDSDGNPIPSTTKKIILPLPPIDHSEVLWRKEAFVLKSCLNPGSYLDWNCCFFQIDYPPFEKNFYNEHEELSSLNGTQVIELRQKLNLRVRTRAAARACRTRAGVANTSVPLPVSGFWRRSSKAFYKLCPLWF